MVEQLQVNVATGSLTEDNTEQAVLLYCTRESLVDTLWFQRPMLVSIASSWLIYKIYLRGGRG